MKIELNTKKILELKKEGLKTNQIGLYFLRNYINKDNKEEKEKIYRDSEDTRSLKIFEETLDWKVGIICNSLLLKAKELRKHLKARIDLKDIDRYFK